MKGLQSKSIRSSLGTFADGVEESDELETPSSAGKPEAGLLPSGPSDQIPDSEWMRDNELNSLIEANDGHYATINAKLLNGLEMGRIPARADAILTTGDVRPKEERKLDWCVDVSVWRSRRGGTRNLISGGGIYTGRGVGNWLEVRLSALRLHRPSVMNYLGWEQPTPPPASSQSRSGRKPSKGWPVFAAALAEWVVINNDDAESIIGYGPDVILDAVLKIAQPRTDIDLPRATFQPAIQEFLSVLEDSEGRRK